MTGRAKKSLARFKTFLHSARFAWFFIAKIFLFGLIYWGIFFVRPDAFNFASGYNNNPMTTFVEQFYLPEDEVEYFLDDAQDLTEGFRQMAAEVDVARRAYLRAETAEEEAEAEYQAALDIFQASIEAQINSYEAEHVQPLEAQKEALEARIESLPFGSPQAPILIGQTIELSEDLLGHLTYIIENRIVFATDESQSAFDTAQRERDHARSMTETAGAAYRELRGELFDHFSTTRNQMIYQIGFADFVYFSACISTTTTFGDVTANLPWVRMLVVLQIFAGIVILAAFLDSLRRPSKTSE